MKAKVASPARSASAPAHPLLDPNKITTPYAMEVRGGCMSPIIDDGFSAAVDPRQQPKGGDIVVIWLRQPLPQFGPFNKVIKQLVLNIPFHVKFPFKNHPDSEVSPVLIVETITPFTQCHVECSDVLAVHLVIGRFPPGKKAGDYQNSEDMVRIENGKVVQP
ncbi:MAG TPA: S24 family peptidase [Xanthobacteraceae bacterium]|jgi:hypothetical protein|nr:S24 family peptidase [Xanthobacteraceae bacterium]